MINVVIADPHPIIQLGLKELLSTSSSINIVGTVSNTEELIATINKKMVEIVIMELDLPDSHGISSLRRLTSEFPHVKSLIFSSQSEDVYALSMIRAGASGYIFKTGDLEIVEHAVLKISAGGMFITNELAQKLALESNTENSRKYFRKLSTREVEVLKMLASGKRNKEVAEGLNLNEKTVSTYKARLMRKLNVSNMVDLLKQAEALELY